MWAGLAEKGVACPLRCPALRAPLMLRFLNQVTLSQDLRFLLVMQMREAGRGGDWSLGVDAL